MSSQKDKSQQQQFAKLSKVATAHAKYLKKEFPWLSLSDYVMYLSLLAAKAVQSGDDAKFVAERFAVYLSRIVTQVLKLPRGKGSSESQQSQG